MSSQSNDVADVTEEMVMSWACKFTQASLVLLGAGPPCQGVSGLNSERKGDRRSSLYFHLPRIIETWLRSIFGGPPFTL